MAEIPTSNRLYTVANTNFEPDQMSYITESLGYNGDGICILPKYITADMLTALRNDLESDRWSRPVAYFQNRPNVIQDYMKIALVLDNGDQDIVSNEFPALKKFADEVTCFGREIVGIWNKTSDFCVNDLDLHRYPPGSNGLGRHKDYPRNPYLTTIATINGDAVFKTDAQEVHVEAGDLLLMRMTGLYKSDKDIRPWHEVQPGDGGRDCVVLRYDPNSSQTQPYDTHYDNWTDQFSELPTGIFPR